MPEQRQDDDLTQPESSQPEAEPDANAIPQEDAHQQADSDSVAHTSETLLDDLDVAEREPLSYSNRAWMTGMMLLIATLAIVGWQFWQQDSAPSPEGTIALLPSPTSTASAQPLLPQPTPQTSPTLSSTPLSQDALPEPTRGNTGEVDTAKLEATEEANQLALEIAAFLSSTVPVIDLPVLPDVMGSAPLPAVAAEGGKPVVIPAMGAGKSVAPSVLTLDLFLSTRPRMLPAIGFVPSAVEAAKLRTIPPTPTPVPVVLTPGRTWAQFIPPSPTQNDHFWVSRPFASTIPNQIAAAVYQFGSTAGGRYRVHHGMDIANPFGTPVLSGATGEVVHAGPDNPEMLGPYNNFYGNTVVIRLDRKLPVAGGGLDVYLLYGHLSQVNVAKGQRVLPDDVVGLVGMTGIAIGPHLHVEMRVGANVYSQSVNPYLWVQPPGGTGAVAVRLLTADGRTWPTARLTLAQYNGNQVVWGRLIEIYPDNESVNPDPAWGENGAMDAVPAGNYFLYGVVNGERVSANLSVSAGQTTFVELRTRQ